MTVPTGALINTAISLTKAVNQPSLSNILGVAQSAVLATGDPSATRMVTNGAGLVNSVTNVLDSGSPASIANTVNSAVRLAQGFVDPNTAGVLGNVSSGINQVFGIIGASNGSGFSRFGAGGNKPVALKTDTMPSQDMQGAYSQGRDVVFTFVRMDSAIDGGSEVSPESTRNLPSANGALQMSIKDSLKSSQGLSSSKLKFSVPVG